MLRKANRLRRPYEFRRTRRRGRAYSHSTMTMYAVQTGEGPLRAGFSVSKKLGNAVERNRVKRVMREGLRANLVEAKPGYDLIFIARPPAALSSYKGIRQAIEELLGRGGLLDNPNS